MSNVSVQSPGMAETVSFRVEDGTTERAEQLAEKLAELPVFAGISFSKSRVYSMALARGLDILEQEHGIQKKKRSKR